MTACVYGALLVASCVATAHAFASPGCIGIPRSYSAVRTAVRCCESLGRADSVPLQEDVARPLERREAVIRAVRSAAAFGLIPLVAAGHPRAVLATKSFEQVLFHCPRLHVWFGFPYTLANLGGSTQE